jgi:type III pantothenate kinase
MKLLLDIGNSRVKWAWLGAGGLERPGGLTHRGRELAEALAGLPLSGPAPEAVLAGSVAGPDLTAAVADAVRRAWRLPLQLAASERAVCGVRCGYHEPRQLGVDRWLALLAAYDRHRRALCVADAGTALTLDVLTAQGEHRGGLIVPGLELMPTMLHRDTGRITGAASMLAAGGEAVDGLGRDTAACVRNGALIALAGMVRRCAQEVGGDAGPAVVVLTGGDAPMLIPALAGVPLDHRPLLVLEGLALRHGGE